MTTSRIDRHTKEHLREYISLCAQFVALDEPTSYALAVDSIRYVNGSKTERDALRVLRDLEDRWYASLEAGNPDYSVYDDPSFLSDLWACWVVYSRQYLREMLSKRSLFGRSIVDDIGPVQRVVDLGCGFGYTTAALAEMFPDADAVGTNLDGTCQFRIASAIGQRDGFRLVSDVRAVGGPADVVFASEYFEHLEAPIDHLREVLDALNPRCLLIANAFNAKALGHFHRYKDGCLGLDFSGKEISRQFNNTLRSHGYEAVKTACWNNRPMYWKKR